MPDREEKSRFYSFSRHFQRKLIVVGSYLTDVLNPAVVDARLDDGVIAVAPRPRSLCDDANLS